MASYPVDIPECSGLSFYGEHLLTVSDSLSKVYMISKAGKVLDSMSFAGNNLEGVVYNPVNQHTYIVEENSNEVVEIDASGLEMNRFFVKLDNLIKKHGLEGISLDLSSGHLYLVSEMAPGLLIKCTLTGEEVKRTNLAFAQDYSSVFFDDVQQKIWILSEDSKTLTRCNLNGNPEKTWFTNIKKGEGLVIDVPNNRIYIITDEVSILYVFSF
ncbi:MAG: SdiA-regulated domain-containing protein [Bacteroidetes bacterium]|nr:SdiA-regulated domain-containing protein [Bacteroidota bacterium]